MKKIVCLYFLIFAVPIFSFSQEKKPVGPVQGSVVKAKQDLTLFSLPGYDEEIYKANASIFIDLRDLGLDDIVPRRVGWVKKDDKLFVTEVVPTAIGNQNYLFIRATYNAPEGTTVEGYARSDFFTISDAPTEANICPGCDAAAANACATNRLSVICQANLFQNLGDDLKNFDNRFKSEAERTAYFEKYKKCGRSDLHDKYLNEYKHYISQAAKSFQIPEGLLSCLLFKENQWDQGRSSAGAIGIAQIMPDNIVNMSNIMKTLELNPDRLSLHRKNKATYERLVQENFARKAKKLPVEPIPSQLYQDARMATTILRNADLAVSWKAYIKNLETTPQFKKSYPKKPWLGDVPTYFDGNRAKTPPLAIGASAMYLKELILLMANKYDEGSIKGDGQLLNFLTAVSGAYNMGPGNAFKLIGTPPPPTADKWVEKMERNPETKKHMRSIRRCMQKGDNKPPYEYRGNKLVEQREC